MLSNAAAGAQRVFELMDQVPEADEGSVELVYAQKRMKTGVLTESSERTSLWAWKQVDEKDGTVSYTKQQGGVVL